jgi:ribosomal protein S18 acetylase RimI-like enzyme
MDALKQLLAICREHPCRTLPNAFWKTAEEGDIHLSMQESSDGSLISLAVWQGTRLMALWAEDDETLPLTPEQVKKVTFALAHANAVTVFGQEEFSRREAFFRLFQQGEPPEFNCPKGFIYQDVRPQEEARAVAGFIRSCYKNIKVDEKTVQGWLAHPVYDSDLWVWIDDAASGEHAALGIGECDVRVPEASLEWVQVLPAYQGKGLGKAVVAELLRRASTGAGFVTVSGRMDNEYRVRELYRRCGFTGSDIWWLLAR